MAKDGLKHQMDAQYFRKNVLPLSRKIYPFALRIIRNKPEAEDVVQEVFMKLWDKRKELDSIDRMEAYLYTMTRNLCLDRAKKHKPKYYDDRQDDAYRFEAADQATDPEESLELKDTMENVNQLIGRLPEQQRTLLHLRDIEGLEYAEISDITGMEINTIRVGISRARKKLKENIEKAGIT